MNATQGIILIMLGVLLVYVVWKPNTINTGSKTG